MTTNFLVFSGVVKFGLSRQGKNIEKDILLNNQRDVALIKRI
jgi:hypothetical protein